VSRADFPALGVGDYVVAGTTVLGDSAVVYHVGMPYVAGVSVVRVKSSVDSVDAAKGTVTAGALVIDYTPYLSTDPRLAPVAGETVEAVGTQPAPGGALVVSPSGDGISLAPAAATAEQANRH